MQRCLFTTLLVALPLLAAAQDGDSKTERTLVSSNLSCTFRGTPVHDIVAFFGDLGIDTVLDPTLPPDTKLTLQFKNVLAQDAVQWVAAETGQTAHVWSGVLVWERPGRPLEPAGPSGRRPLTLSARADLALRRAPLPQALLKLREALGFEIVVDAAVHRMKALRFDLRLRGARKAVILDIFASQADLRWWLVGKKKKVVRLGVRAARPALLGRNHAPRAALAKRLSLERCSVSWRSPSLALSLLAVHRKTQLPLFLDPRCKATGSLLLSGEFTLGTLLREVLAQATVEATLRVGPGALIVGGTPPPARRVPGDPTFLSLVDRTLKAGLEAWETATGTPVVLSAGVAAHLKGRRVPLLVGKLPRNLALDLLTRSVGLTWKAGPKQVVISLPPG